MNITVIFTLCVIVYRQTKYLEPQVLVHSLQKLSEDCKMCFVTKLPNTRMVLPAMVSFNPVILLGVLIVTSTIRALPK